MNEEKIAIDNFILFFTSDDKEREQMRQVLEDYLKTELCDDKIIFSYSLEDIMSEIYPYEEDEPPLAEYLKSKQIRQDYRMFETINDSIRDIIHQHIRDYRREHPEEQQVTAT